MTNYGVSGSLIAQQDGKTNSFIERYSAMTNDADYIFVFGGTNDYWNGTGIFGTSTSTSDEEFVGALNNLITGLKTKYPTGKIILITPYKQYWQGVGSSTNNIASSKNMGKYAEQIVQAAARHHIEYIDLYKIIGFDVETVVADRNKYAPDGVHLNDNGHRILANIIISYLQNTLTTVHTQNILYEATYFDGYYDNSGTPSAFSGVSYTDYIEIKPSTWYAIYNEAFEAGLGNTKVISYYDENKTYISYLNAYVETKSIIMVDKTPINAKYIRLNVTTDRKISAFMREIVNYDIFTVRFETNGGNEIYRQSILSGEKVTVATPTKTGYNFVGWYKDASLTEPFSIVIDTISEDTTLYAKWTPVTSGDSGSVIIDNADSFTTLDYLLMAGGVLLVIVIATSNKGKKKGKWS